MGSRRAVLVTGASRGIGLATTGLLARQGYRVFAGVRRPESPGDGLAELAGRLPDAVVPVAVDLTEPGTYRTAAGLVQEQVGPSGLHGLVNNAGYAVPAPLEFLPLDQLRAQLEVNLVGHLGVTQAVLPMLRAARGRIVNVSSIGGLVAGPMVGAYHMSKFAMEAMNDTLRRELRHLGVGVIAIEPGAVDTGIWGTSLAHAGELAAAAPAESARLYRHLIERATADARSANQRGISPDVVAAAIADVLGARRPPARRTVGRDALVGRLASTLLPAGLIDRILAPAPRQDEPRPVPEPAG
jgi:NAD(P)-dependent dehydrogenase (short-subunit alcohol dehydrogenase family)